MAKKYLIGDSAVYRHVRLLTTSLVAFYNCLYTAGMFLTAEEVATLQHHTLAFGTSYKRLRNLAASVGALVWLVRPNVHRMQHAPELASHFNPVHAQCYGEESFMGTEPKCGRSQCLGPTREMYRGWCL